MRKTINIIVMTLCCFILCSCYDRDPYKGKRPIDYADSNWICEEYEIYFSVDENKNLTNTQIVIENQKIPFTFLWSKFDNTVNINFELNSQKDSLVGVCEFSQSEFVVSIDDTKGYYSENQIVLHFLCQ